MTGNAPTARYATRNAAKPRRWQDLAVCREVDPDVFFPDSKDDTVTYTEKDAKKVCRHCPVVAQCLEFALSSGQEAGVWGGLNPRELKKARKRRGLAAVREPDPRSWDPPKPKVQPLGVCRPKQKGTALERALARREELVQARQAGRTVAVIAGEFRTHAYVIEEAFAVIDREQQAASGLGVAA